MNEYTLTLTSEELTLVKYALCTYELELENLMKQDKQALKDCRSSDVTSIIQGWLNERTETLRKVVDIETKIYAP